MHKKLNILFVAESFYPYTGGVEKHIHLLSKKLIEDGHKVTVLTYKKNKDDKTIDFHNKIKIYRLNNRRNKYLNFAGLLKQLLLQNILNENYDIIHYHDYSVFNILFRILSKKTNIKKGKSYITFHGWEGIFPIPEYIKKKRKYCEDNTAGNICVGHFIEKWYETNADVITYGAVEEKTIDMKTDRQILFSGRLEHDTGFSDILDAFEEIAKKENGYKLVICGKGSLVKFIEGRKNVEYKGWISDTSEMIAKSEYVFASGYLSMLEALILKKKVICYYNNELKKDYFEMIPNYDGMMWTAGSKEDLIKVFKNASEDKVKVEAGYEFAKRQTWDKLKQDYYKIWKY